MITETKRLLLARPTSEDLTGLHAISSDPRVWAHFPSLRHTDWRQTETMLEQWINAWTRDGLGTWIVRSPGDRTIAGYGGCSIVRESFWNLGYRFAFEAQGQGYATEVSFEALRQANSNRPDLAVVASLLEHNAASARVAQKVGLVLQHRGPDVGNPDPKAMRLIYADRQLNADHLSAIVR